MAALLKNLYNKEYIKLLNTHLNNEIKDFNALAFKEDVFSPAFETMELKERMHHIAKTLHKHLPFEYTYSLEILKRVFLRMNHAFGLENMIFQDYVALYGMDDILSSLDALAVFTQNSSSEFAIREFILRDETQTMAQMRLWTESKSEHLRRLASEGCRPRLPWAIALPKYKKDPTAVIEILKVLKDDESAYVRKSVANNLNDIVKDNPKRVKEITKEWIGFSKERDALLKHACRTLLKESDKETLALFGFSSPNAISVEEFQHTQEVAMGEELHFSFKILSLQSIGKIRVEFALHFLRKNNKHNKKVFKISESFVEGKSKELAKSYSFRPISTRVYYKGVQKLSIIINGVVFKEVEFKLF